MNDLLTRKLLDQLLSEGRKGVGYYSVGANDGLTLSGEDSDVIEFKGRRFVPDQTKGYFRAKMSYGFPVRNAYGQAAHPNVIAISYQSLLHQNINREHTLVAYDRQQNQSDKIIGSVLEVDFPSTPIGGWKVPKDKKDAPGIEFVGCFSKLAQGMSNVVGRHKTGRHKFSVSMEATYPYKECAFAVGLNGKTPKYETPDDMVECGYEFIPWLDAPEDLLACFSIKKNRVVSNWKGREVVLLSGGLDKPIHYSGTAIVLYGAEPEAEILRMAASNSEEKIAEILNPLRNFVSLFSKKV